LTREIAEYERAARAELRGLRRHVRRHHVERISEHLHELDEQELSTIEPPIEYARAYREEHGLRSSRLPRFWRRLDGGWKGALVTVVALAMATVTLGTYARASHLTTTAFLLGTDENKPVTFESLDRGGVEATFVSGGVIVFGEIVENTGLLAITLLEPSTGALAKLLRPVDVVDFTACAGRYVPSKCPRRKLPITVEPGRRLELGFRFKLTPCAPFNAGTVVRVEDFPLRSRSLQIEHLFDVPVTDSFVIRFAKDAERSTTGMCAPAA
jgi:hypothetical protein